MTQASQQQTETAVARRVNYEPLAPVGSPMNLKHLLEAQKGSLSEVLPKHVTPDRLMKTMLVAANRTPDLFQCTQASILETVSRAGELGLDLSGTLGEAYPVPFNNKVGDRWLKQCQLIIGYRGLAKLARQSGEVKRIEAEVVCENDHFEYAKGIHFKLEFAPLIRGDRGEPIGAYALVEFKDGTIQAEFMAFDDIEKVRQRSKSGSYTDKKTGEERAIGAWKSDWGEMAKKTVFRRLSKWLPLSAEKFQQALEVDAADYDTSRILSVEPIDDGRSKSARLADRLTGPSQPAEAPDTPETPDAPQEEAAPAESDAEPIDEPGAFEPEELESNPHLSDELVKALANRCGCTLDEALDRLEGHCQKVRSKSLPDLGAKERASVKKLIDDGDLTV